MELKNNFTLVQKTKNVKFVQFCLWDTFFMRLLETPYRGLFLILTFDHFCSFLIPVYLVGSDFWFSYDSPNPPPLYIVIYFYISSRKPVYLKKYFDNFATSSKNPLVIEDLLYLLRKKTLRVYGYSLYPVRDRCWTGVGLCAAIVIVMIIISMSVQTWDYIETVRPLLY